MEIAGLAVSAGSLMLTAYRELKNRSSNGLDIHLTLGEAIQMLCAVRDDREHEYCKFRETKERTNTYSTWLDMVNKLENKAKELIAKHEKRSRRSFKNPISKLDEDMKKKTTVALSLYLQVIDVMHVEGPPERVVKMYPPNIEEYETLKGPLNLILRHLRDNISGGVRLYGKLGVGKTVIMKNLNDHADIAALFELVIWLNVSDAYSNHFSTRKMQEDIAKRLKINMEGRDNFKERIGNELRGKKYLLLLDDVNKDLNLEKIGIHLSEGSGSKIVLTCREKHLCPWLVSHWQSVEIKRLSYPEAQKMFQKFLHDSRTPRVMREVINFCCGLPYLIEKIARAFTSLDNDDEWETALNNLIYFPQRGDPAIKKVYKHIEFFCNQLEGTAKHDCFLHSALYPGESDINTNCLLDCWTAEALCDTRLHARQILQELKGRSYLEEVVRGPLGEYVRMEKYLWSVAYNKLLADDQRRHLVKTGESLQHPPTAKDWNYKHRISLVDCNLRGLPECPDSPMLFTLFLQNNQSLDRIDTNFFEKMGDLLVLNLENTGIVSLPSSIRQLKKLKVFYLNDCTSLLQLPLEIGELGNLEVLHIRGTGIDKVRDPSLYQRISAIVVAYIRKVIFREPNLGPWAPFPNIGCLSCLKHLSVSFQNFGNENFSQEVLCFCEAISKISTTLEELLIDVNTYRILCNSMINVVRDSVATMARLTSLKFSFKDGVEEVIKVVAGKKIFYFPEAGDVVSFLDLDTTSFEVYIGCSISRHRTPELNEYEKYVKICNAQGLNSPTPHIRRLLSRCNAIEVVDNGDLEHLSQFGADSLVGVQGCLIEGCKKIEAIADGDTAILADPMLPCLQELYMKKIPMLKSIWKGPWNAGSLVKLETLLIEDCIEIEELLADSGISQKLRNLKKLILTNLEKLRRICEIQDSMWLALEELCIYGCPLVTELPFENQNAMKLKKLILVNLPILTNWANVVNWPALEELQMCGCPEISMLSLGTDSTRNLRKLILYDLPSLTTLSTDASLAWPALEELEIRGCPSLTELPFRLDSAPRLKFIKALQRWWDNLTWDHNVRERFERFFQPL